MPAQSFDIPPSRYEALIDWEKRLANEAPLFRALFARHRVQRVLDAACGTGRHARMFHEWGLAVEGADASPAMIEQCRANYGESPTLRWVVRRFESPPDPQAPFDAVVCLGNSLALAPDMAAAEAAIRAMLGAIAEGGVCVLQVLNLWALPSGPCVWQKCVTARLDGELHVLVKGVHRVADAGYVEMIDLTLRDGGTRPAYESTRWLGIDPDWLVSAARAAGARSVQLLGGYQSQPYARDTSTDLLAVIER